MHALVLPLSEILFNFEKYNGDTFYERTCKKYPWYGPFVNSKIGKGLIIVLLCVPSFVLAVLFFFGPIYLFHIVRYGYSKAKKRMHAYLDRINEKFNNDESIHLNKVAGKKRRNRMHDASVFLYYTSAMLPKGKRRQKKFFKKLEAVKKEINIHHIQQANTNDEIQTMIWLFDIDQVELLLDTLQTEIAVPELFIPLYSTPVRKKKKEIADAKKHEAALMNDDDSDIRNANLQLKLSGRGCIRHDFIEDMNDVEEDGRPLESDREFYQWLYAEGFLRVDNRE